MGTMDIIQVAGFSLPMLSALVCCVLMIMYRRGSSNTTQRRLAAIMILTYVTAVICWFGIIVYVADYDWFVWINTLFFFAMMLDQVLLCNFLYNITGTGKREKLHKLHYVIPVLLAVLMGVWSLLVPYEVQYYIVETRGEPAPGYLWYSRFFSATVPIFIIYNIIYPLLGLFRIKAYRREVVNYSADEQRASTGWLYRLIFLVWLTLPVASGVLFVHKSVFFSSPLTVLGAFLPIFQYLIICYNLMSGNYVIIQPTETEESEGDGNAKAKKIDRKKFETYIREKKPYLNSKLKITDMCAELGTNRSYLSSFINSEYGMNFSGYINRQRLDELDRIRVAPENRNAAGIDLVLCAGFSSYRSYIRVKARDDASQTIVF